jgi:prepilin-type N-terminal cleavage/methylation domain-containing protein
MNSKTVKLISKSGFTLVEMMVAIAVFSIVMVVATGALMNVIDANRKAQAIKTAINNVNFALESISKDMRVGTEYNCAANIGGSPDLDCPSGGGHLIAYRSQKEFGKFVFYRYDQINVGGKQVGQIQRCVGAEDKDVGCAAYVAVTSSDINILRMKFYVVGATNADNPPGDKSQPRVIITLTGEAGGVQDKIRTTFDLQTTVSQRARILRI